MRLEGGPLQEEWWVEDARTLVPYLNVTAQWSGAPDQGLLHEKGGRAFPYCVLMDADGAVLWEVRPTSREALRAGVRLATLLAELRAAAQSRPDDAGLAASVALLDARGREQRPRASGAQLDAWLATPDLDPRVRDVATAWMEGLRYEALVRDLQRRHRRPRELAAAFYETWRGGTRPPAGSSTAVTFWTLAARGALAAEDREGALACLEPLEALAASDQFGPPLRKLVTDLRTSIEALGR